MDKFLIEDYDLLEKCDTLQDKVSTDIKNEFDGKPFNNKKSFKTKTKSHRDEVADFYDKEIPKVDSHHTCSAVISSDESDEE